MEMGNIPFNEATLAFYVRRFSEYEIQKPFPPFRHCLLLAF